jgi:hypothetical protein
MVGYTTYGNETKILHDGHSNIAAPNHVRPDQTQYSITPFDGDCNYSEYAKWELMVENELFSMHHFSEKERLRAITSAFMGYALTWWEFICENKEIPKH